MKRLHYNTITTTAEYNQLLNDLYSKVKQRPEEVFIPKVNIISVSGNEPPASKQYQAAIACLYGIGYTLSFGLQFKVLPQPKGYFPYKVGGLETLWWSTTGQLEITNPRTLRWQAYLMIPNFVTAKLFKAAMIEAKKKKSDIPYEQTQFTTISEGHAVQMLHIGPYDQEKTTVAVLTGYANAHHLALAGRHHEIYISDPRRVKPAKLKTVVRYPVVRQ